MRNIVFRKTVQPLDIEDSNDERRECDCRKASQDDGRFGNGADRVLQEIRDTSQKFGILACRSEDTAGVCDVTFGVCGAPFGRVYGRKRKRYLHQTIKPAPWQYGDKR